MKSSNGPDKRKRVVKMTKSETDSTASYSREKQVLRPSVKKKVTENYSVNLNSSKDNFRKERTKETSRKLVTENRTRNWDYNSQTGSDSTYKQVVRKPTENRPGSVKTTIRAVGPNSRVNTKTKTPIPKKKKL